MWIILALGFVLLAAGGSKAIGTLVAQPWTPGGVKPAMPQDGDDFRMGPQPDPAAPSDPNRGRFFGLFGQAKYEGHVADHEAPLVNLASDARGKLEVIVWASRQGKPERCTMWAGSIEVVNGRAVFTTSKWSFPVSCGSQHATWTDPGGCHVEMPVLRFEPRGADVVLLWRTKVKDFGNEWRSNDCDEPLGFYVDVFWRFKSVPKSSGVER